MRHWIALTLLLAGGAAALADEVTHWNTITLNSIRAGQTPPPRASRALGMVHAAVFDAVNSVDRAYRPYAVNMTAPAGTSREAAAAQAAHDVLASVFPGRAGIFASELTASLNAIPDSPGKANGISLGSAVASQMLALRAGDGSTAVVPYTPGTLPGQWRPTLPIFQAAVLPGWGQVQPFAMSSGSQFRPGPPPALNSPEYTAAFEEVRTFGSSASMLRTNEQTEIAFFWADGPGTETPPGHWNSIAQDVAAARGHSLLDNARLFGMLNVTLADAAIASWDAKYTYNFWRPIAGIREAATDGNDDTTADEGWTPLIGTPAFPAYTSGHSTFSGAAAAVLAEYFGTDAIAFSTQSDGLGGVTRDFPGFWAAAAEAGQSRIYGGIHWQFDNQAGLSTGRQLGQYVAANYFGVIPEPGTLALAAAAMLTLGRRRCSAAR